MSNIKKLPNRKSSQKKSSVVPFTRQPERGVVINLEEKISKAIEIRLGKFVKEIQLIKAKQKKLELRQKLKREKGSLDQIGKNKKMKKTPKKTNNTPKPKKTRK